MDKYAIMQVLGEGAFGKVVKAQNKKTQDVVAIKQIKTDFKTWEECLQLRELKSLKKLKRLPYIVSLQELIRDRNQLYFVFEFKQSNLADEISNQRDNFTPKDIVQIMFGLLTGLAAMHRSGFFHRDIKPENLLCDPGGANLRIADFGLAREVRSRPPYTDYVSTRWYRVF